MDTQEVQEIKKEFQLERIILFSDAVFAIIITIMVIELKLPEAIMSLNAEKIRPHEDPGGAKSAMVIKVTRHAFKELIPRIVGYVVSFFLVANFWIRHIRVCSYLKDYNTTFLALNLLFLFCISLFPFGISTAAGALNLKSLVFQYGVNIYIGIILSAIFTQAIMVTYLVRNKAALCINNPDMEEALKYKTHPVILIAVPILALAVILFNYFHLNLLFSLYTIPALALITSIARRRYYPQTDKK